MKKLFFNLFLLYNNFIFSQDTSKVDTSSTLTEVEKKTQELTDLFSVADIFLMVAILIFTYYIIKFISFIADLLAKRFTRRRLFIMKLVPILRISFWLLAFYLIIFGILKPTTESLIAFSATAGIAIGFAAQDVLKNIFGGIVILIDRPFSVGDLVDIGDYHGEVVNIGLRSTRVLTRDDSIISIPNSEVVSNSVSNANSGALNCMVVTDLYLPSKIDTILVKSICYEAAATSPYTYTKKPIVIKLTEEFDVEFITKISIKAYVYDHRLEPAFSTDLIERSKSAFIKNNLIPGEYDLTRRKTSRQSISSIKVKGEVDNG